MGEIQQQIQELKALAEMEMLPESTRQEILMAIKLAESVEEYDTKKSEEHIKSKIKINFINKSDNKNPLYAKEGDSGFDLRANIKEPITLKPLERKLIDTGLVFELPKGFDMEIRSRSGLALKNGIMVLNSPGTIDLSYRGNIGIILINFGDEDFTINNGDRIAQGLIRWSLTDDNIDLIQVDDISENTVRGINGFGHSGSK